MHHQEYGKLFQTADGFNTFFFYYCIILSFIFISPQCSDKINILFANQFENKLRITQLYYFLLQLKIGTCLIGVSRVCLESSYQQSLNLRDDEIRKFNFSLFSLI